MSLNTFLNIEAGLLDKKKKAKLKVKVLRRLARFSVAGSCLSQSDFNE